VIDLFKNKYYEIYLVIFYLIAKLSDLHFNRRAVFLSMPQVGEAV